MDIVMDLSQSRLIQTRSSCQTHSAVIRGGAENSTKSVTKRPIQLIVLPCSPPLHCAITFAAALLLYYSLRDRVKSLSSHGLI